MSFVCLRIIHAIDIQRRYHQGSERGQLFQHSQVPMRNQLRPCARSLGQNPCKSDPDFMHSACVQTCKYKNRISYNTIFVIFIIFSIPVHSPRRLKCVIRDHLIKPFIVTFVSVHTQNMLEQKSPR